MKFPALKGKPVWPAKPVYPWCKKNKVMEPHSMAILAGGAMRVIDRKKKSATIADDCIGFLDVVWHGAHGGGNGSDREICARVPLADDTPAGQFEFYFCSTRCLREFLNACVDELETKVKNARMKLPKREHDHAHLH